MSSLKKTLMKQGMKLMSDPRVMKIMQDERVMKAAMAALGMPAKARGFARDKVESLAKAMALATEDEVEDLRRTVRSLEDELARLKKQQPKSDAPPASRKKSTAAE